MESSYNPHSTNNLVCWLAGAVPVPGPRRVRNSRSLLAEQSIQSQSGLYGPISEEGKKGGRDRRRDKGRNLRRIRGCHPSFQIKRLLRKQPP